MTALILASTSPYRRELLARLHLPFDTVDPWSMRRPAWRNTLQLATRLGSRQGAGWRPRRPDAIVIGPIRSPTWVAPPWESPAATQPLWRRFSGCGQDPALPHRRGRGAWLELVADVATVTVRVRDVSDAAIERYLRLDQPYDCAGSAKVESPASFLLETVEF